MEELNEVSEGRSIEKRPKFLLVLAILSFINIGTTIFTSFFGIIGGKPSAKELESVALQFANSQEQLAQLSSSENVDLSYWTEILTKMEVLSNNMFANFTMYNLLILMMALFALTAVYFMFIGRKIGFHLYVGYCFLYVIQSYFFTAPKDVPTFIIVINTIYGGIWVLLYSRNLKWMN